MIFKSLPNMDAQVVKQRTIQMNNKLNSNSRLDMRGGRGCQCKHTLVVDPDSATVESLNNMLVEFSQSGVDSASDEQQALNMLSLKLQA